MSTIPIAPGPWTCKATVYTFLTYVTASQAKVIGEDKGFLYEGLEAEAEFGGEKFVGGLAMVQVIKYQETPVGKYDELLIIPGFFEWERKSKGKDGKGKKGKNARICRIYVSQRDTCWNGRKNWNIPKHLASFKFTNLPNNGISISIHPHTVSPITGLEDTPTTLPFFTASFTPISYLPAFPTSTAIAGYLGLDISIVQPPVPKGKDEELVGTDEWCHVMPKITCGKTSVGWWDLRQEKSEGVNGGREGYENWFPGIGRWRMGVVMEDAIIELGEGEHWVSAKL